MCHHKGRQIKIYKLQENMRTLNLEEKRRIEKLLFVDIEKRIEDYENERNTEKGELIEKLENNIPQPTQKAFTEYNKAYKESQAKEKFIEKLGYSIRDWDDKKLSVNTYGNEIPAELKDFNRETERTKKALETLKREFTLKLYAGDVDEVQMLFGELAKKLDSTIKVN